MQKKATAQRASAVHARNTMQRYGCKSMRQQGQQKKIWLQIQPCRRSRIPETTCAAAYMST
eukprot:1275048-Pleurochrysis_carterae.AAC.3